MSGIEEHLTLGTLAIFLALVINLGGLIWGASKFASSVTRIEKDVIPTLLNNLTKLTELVQSHDRDIAVLKALSPLAQSKRASKDG